jgi:hypothetical protein
MRSTTAHVFLFASVAVLLAGGQRLSAQAMISYGHGVAKAAGAGATAGAGVGGILSGLGNPLSRAAGRGRNSSTSGGTTATRQRVVPQRRQNINWDMGPQRFAEPAPVGLIGGVQATGLATEHWQPSLLAPSENLTVLAVQWGGAGPASVAVAPESTDEPLASAPTEAELGEVAIDPLAEPEVDEAEQVVILRPARGSGSTSRRNSVARADSTPSTIPDGIAVGLTVEELISRLGRPQISFRGVAGAGYTDQYIFELSDGRDLVVYVLDGIVSHLAVT